MRGFRTWLFTALLFGAVAPANAEWWEARTDHFIVYSESSSSDAQNFALDLERFDGALRMLQNVKFSPVASDAQRLTVYRFGDVDDIGRLAGSSGVAGFYIPRIGGSVAFTPARSDRIGGGGSIIRRDKRTDLDPRSVLRHEYAHHFMFQHFSAAYPSWYIEGFAETAATIDLKDDGSFHVGNPPQYRSDAIFSPMMTLSPSTMLTSTSRPDFLDVYGHYTVGWLLNHYLSFGGERPGQLTNYLSLINRGADSATAARQAFGDLNKLDRDVIRYRNSRRLGGADVRPTNYTPPRVTMRKLNADEEAIMNVEMRVKRGVNRKKARDVAADARAVAARYPQSVDVNLSLAEAELAAQNFAQAERAIDLALAAQPNSVPAMLIKGEIYLERGEKEKQYLPNARTWFAKAYAADRNHPGSLFYNYLTYFESGGAIPETALVGLERAFQMAPYETGVRLVLARQLLAEKKGMLARDILQPVVLNAHESKDGKVLTDVVKLIDARKDAEAYAKLAAQLEKWEKEAEEG